MTEPEWPPDAVRALLASDARIESVHADPDYGAQVIEQVCDEECELAMYAATRQQWSKTNTLTYDAARKAVEAMLLAVGWRVRAAPGAHAVVGEIVQRWLADEPDPGPRIAEKFDAARKARHDDEYPHPRARPRTDRELRALAQDNVRLVNLVREVLALPPRPELIPTEANVATFSAN